MRTQKHNSNEKALKHGYIAAIKKRSKESCPYKDINKKASWLAGWREGHDDSIFGKNYH